MGEEAEILMARNEQKPERTSPFGLLRRHGLLFAISAILLVFLLGASSWVRFFLSPGEVGAGGNRTVLFTAADYPAIVIAARIAASGKGDQLYDLSAQLREQNRLNEQGAVVVGKDVLAYPYPYTPFIAVLLSPLVGLPPLTGMAVWDVLNIAGMAGGLWFLLSTLPLPRTTKLLMLAAAISSFPFIINLQQGQSSGVTMLGLAVGIALLRQRRDLPAGLALGILLLKIQWLPLLGVVLLWKRRAMTLLGMVITGAVLMAMTLLTIGTGWIGPYMDIVDRAQKFSREFLLDPGYSHSLTGALAAMLGSSNDDLIRLLNNGATLLLAALLVYLWRQPWQPGTPQWDALMAITALGAIFTSLQLNTHDLCLLALPAALGLSYVHNAGLSENARLLWYGIIWGAYLMLALLPPGVILGMPVVRLSAWLIGAMLAVLVVWVLRGPATQRQAI